jgi:hypothetical protein
MSNARHGSCEAFIIDRGFDHSRNADQHHGDWRGPRQFAEERRKAGKAVHVVYATSVSQAVHCLLHQVHRDRRHGMIRVLRFFGHGAPGIQNVGGNRDFTNDATLIKVVGGHVLHRHLLAHLRKLLNPQSSRVELHGCSVAEGGERGPGHALLVKLATLFNVPVLAAAVVQHSLTTGQATFAQGKMYAAIPGKPHLFEQDVEDYTLDNGASKPPDTSHATGPHAEEWHSAFGQAS